MKILVIYASFGSGHKRAAEAVVEAFQDEGLSAEIRDLLEFLPAPMSKFYSWAYEFMITNGRTLWRVTYNLVNAPKGPYRPATALSQKWQFRKLKEFLHDGAFTHVICTHFTPSALLTDWRPMREIESKIFSIITDHEAHRCWKRTGLDHYFVASQRVSSEMQQIGVVEKDITVSGIPISNTFSTSLPRDEARKALGLPQDENVALILCSAVTTKKSVQMLKEFLTVNHPVQYLVVAGPDSGKENELKARFEKNKCITIFGFTPRIPEMMKASDVIVTKPGGLIVSEALAVGLPQILLEPIPGQEEANAQHAVEQGAAICVLHKPSVYSETLNRLLGDSARLQQMSEASRKAGKPDAAKSVVKTILSKFVV